MLKKDEITVISRKFDQSIRRTWKCRLIERHDPLLVFVGEFDLDVEHPDLGFIAKGTVSYEYYWLDRWYNVFRFENTDGSFRNFYCNINMPPTFRDSVLDYVDLEIDIVVWPDGMVNVLDEDDFAANAALFDYPDEVVANARTAQLELIRMINDREHPFLA